MPLMVYQAEMSVLNTKHFWSTGSECSMWLVKASYGNNKISFKIKRRLFVMITLIAYSCNRIYSTIYSSHIQSQATESFQSKFDFLQ